MTLPCRIRTRILASPSHLFDSLSSFCQDLVCKLNWWSCDLLSALLTHLTGTLLDKGWPVRILTSQVDSLLVVSNNSSWRWRGWGCWDYFSPILTNHPVTVLVPVEEQFPIGVSEHSSFITDHGISLRTLLEEEVSNILGVRERFLFFGVNL